MHPSTENIIPTEEGVEMLLAHKEHSSTQRHRIHYSHRGRGRNAAGTQRTLMHPKYRKHYSHRGRARNAAGTQRALKHPEAQKTLFPQRQG